MTNKTAIEPGTPDRDPDTPSDEPLFLRAAREAGAKLGVSAESILAEDRRAAESPTFPSEECFYPEEAEWFLSAKIELDESDDAGRALDEHLKREFEERSAHLAGCVFCQAMLASMEPVHTRREAFLEVVRQEAPYQKVIEIRNLLERCRAYTKMIWPLGLSVVGALLVLLTRLAFPENSITGAVASNALTSSNVVALIMVIVAVAIVYVYVQWPRFVPQQDQLVHTFSSGVGISAALIILAVVGNEWREFSGSYAELQAELISSLQDSYKHSLQGDAFPPINKEKDGMFIHTDLRGLNYAVYTATRKDLPGRLIATARRDGGEIKWTVSGSERTTQDVKLGMIRTVGEDRFQLILQSGDIIEGKPDDMRYELIDGRMGLAVIPYGSDKLAALHPLEEFIAGNN